MRTKEIAASICSFKELRQTYCDIALYAVRTSTRILRLFSPLQDAGGFAAELVDEYQSLVVARYAFRYNVAGRPREAVDLIT